MNLQFKVLAEVPNITIVNDAAGDNLNDLEVLSCVPSTEYPFNKNWNDAIASIRTEFKEETAKLNAKLDKIIDLIENQQRQVRDCQILPNPPDDIDVNEIIFNLPATTVEELEHFETLLSDKNFKLKISREYTKEFANTGYVAKRVCYLLIEKFVNRAVLTHYTWTGSSKGNLKKSFSALSNINQLFYAIVKKCDSTYTELQHADFFKKCVLKYSEVRAASRNTSKRVSTPRVTVPKKRLALDLTVMENNEYKNPDDNILNDPADTEMSN